MPDDLDAIRQLERQMRTREALGRALVIEPKPTSPRDAPLASPATVVGGQPIEWDGGAWLAGLPLRSGDAIEVYTNAVTGWLRGRFAWSGSPGDPPRLTLNLWDPRGPADGAGLAPAVGVLDAEIPKLAICRRTS